MASNNGNTMHKGRLFIYALAVATLIAAAATIVLISPVPRQRTGNRLVVAVTFPSLAPDVKQLLCPGDELYTVAPPGVDPHDYQLKPGDVAKLREATVIVSTGHAPFEAQIESLAEQGEFNATLIVITRVPGVKIYLNPATHQPNLHMPIYDPHNYIAYIRFLASKLAQANPRCKSHYVEAASQAIARVNTLLEKAPSLNLHAAATTPLAQYAVTWLNVSVDKLFIKEHDVPPSPDDIRDIEAAAAAHRIQLIVIVEAGRTPVNQKAREIASAYGLPVLEVPSPLTEETIPGKLSTILAQARRLSAP